MPSEAKNGQNLPAEAKANSGKAVNVWSIILQRFPNLDPTTTAHAYYFSAVCYHRYLGEYEKGIGYFQHVLDRYLDYQYGWSAQYMIAVCYEQLRDSGEIPEVTPENCTIAN